MSDRKVSKEKYIAAWESQLISPMSTLELANDCSAEALALANKIKKDSTKLIQLAANNLFDN